LGGSAPGAVTPRGRVFLREQTTPSERGTRDPALSLPSGIRAPCGYGEEPRGGSGCLVGGKPRGSSFLATPGYGERSPSGIMGAGHRCPSGDQAQQVSVPRVDRARLPDFFLLRVFVPLCEPISGQWMRGPLVSGKNPDGVRDVWLVGNPGVARSSQPRAVGNDPLRGSGGSCIGTVPGTEDDGIP
jgi:hypothetical protein